MGILKRKRWSVSVLCIECPPHPARTIHFCGLQIKLYMGNDSSPLFIEVFRLRLVFKAVFTAQCSRAVWGKKSAVQWKESGSGTRVGGVILQSASPLIILLFPPSERAAMEEGRGEWPVFGSGWASGGLWQPAAGLALYLCPPAPAWIMKALEWQQA